MGMTMTQKILAAHAGLAEVKAGQLIEADLDLVLGNDITTPVAVNEMKKMDNQTVFNHDKIALVMDHFIPNKDIKSAENCKCCREFACRHDITNYFDVGVIVPPMNIQKEFARFCNPIMITIEKNADEIRQLFKLQEMLLSRLSR